MPIRIATMVIGAALAATALPVLAQSPAGSADAAKNKVSMCIGCHGIAAYKTAFPDVYHVPKIGGQTQAYIVNALKAYKSGERSHPSMKSIAESLSEQDMADLAAYYGAKK